MWKSIFIFSSLLNLVLNLAFNLFLQKIQDKRDFVSQSFIKINMHRYSSKEIGNLILLKVFTDFKIEKLFDFYSRYNNKGSNFFRCIFKKNRKIDHPFCMSCNINIYVCRVITHAWSRQCWSYWWLWGDSYCLFSHVAVVLNLILFFLVLLMMKIWLIRNYLIV